MIPVSTADEDLLLGTRFGVHLKVEVEKSSSTSDYWDLSALVGSNWIDGVSVRQDVDRLVGQADVTLLRDVSSSQSICPLRDDSTVNQSSSGGTSLVIDVTREAKISVATIAASCSPVSTDYHLLLRGEIDEWDARENPMRLSVRDPGGFLMDRWIESKASYGSSSGDPIEDVMQSIIDDALGSTDIEVQESSSPGFLMAPAFKQEEMPILDALNTLKDLIGWDLRYRWSTGDDDYTLQFYPPERTSTTPDSTFGPDRYATVPRLAIDRADIRNVIEVEYPSSTSDEWETITVSDTSSIDKYGRRWMRIVEAQDSPIDTSSEATDLANAALEDLAEPDVEQEIDMHLWWPVELNDLYRWQGNATHYSTDQDLAVSSFRHEISRDRHRTVMGVRGNPRSATKRWINQPSTDRLWPEVLDVTLALDDDGNVDMSVTVNQESLSIKYAVGSTDYPTRATVEATTAKATGTDHIYTETGITTLSFTESAWVRALAIDADGSGRESLDSMVAKITREAQTQTASLVGLAHTAFDSTTDIEWTVDWVSAGGVTSSQHHIDVEYYEEGTLIDAETGILVTSTMSYLHDSTGAGGTTDGTQAWVKAMLVESTSGNMLNSYDTRRQDILR